ncbi:patatin-like phospholipase family protein [Flindersiella endophytica]
MKTDRKPESRNADLVLEGGGVKGLGLVGAVTALAEAGYRFQRTAGTSAGAIVACLIAALNHAGESYDRLEDIARTIDYRKFRDRGRIGSVMAGVGLGPLVDGLSVLLDDGVYEGEYLRRWLENVLGEFGVRRFGDLRLPDDPGSDLPAEKRYGLVVIVSDLSRQRMIRFPWDCGDYGLEPDELPVALAVRASASIPFFFEPVTLQAGAEHGRSTLVDGGLLSNYPITIFDRQDRTPPRWPTFGVRLSPADLPISSEPIKGALSLGKSVFETMVQAHDALALENPAIRARTIFVDTDAISAVDFGISDEEQDMLMSTGCHAGEEFLQNWDFGAYIKRYRGEDPADG